MEKISTKLFNLLKEELYDLNTGHDFNVARIRLIRQLCHILIYNKYVKVSDIDLMKIVKFYE